ncbi:MAG: hypothetical protein J7M18_07810 [Candidatus Eremiobacteraeota bacterium]|nr:hypothetical protein [Candidatus Eremiobacteraeota bacterium]
MIKARMIKQGITLIELLTTFLILILSAGVLFWKLVLGKIVFQAGVLKTSGHQDLQVANQKIALELGNSSVDTLTDSTPITPSAFSFLSAYDSSGKFITGNDGMPVWQKYVIYYIPSGTTKLLRRVVHGNFTGPLLTSLLAGYWGGTGNIISPSIITMLPDNITGDSAALSLTSETRSRHGKINRQSTKIDIYIRN